MTASIYPTVLSDILNETFDWTAEEIRVLLLGPSFIYDPFAQYLNDVPPEHIIADSVLGLANRTYEDGVARGDPAEYLQLLSNQLISGVILYQDVGDDAYSPLIAYYPSTDVLGTPRAAIGEDIYVYTPVDPGGWFQIVDEVLEGTINGGVLGGNLSLAELSGGLQLVMPTLLIDGRLNVGSHVICAPASGGDDCCEPTIRSSRCE